MKYKLVKSVTDVWEWCSHCNTEVLLTDAKYQTYQPCPECKAEILPCSLCNPNTTLCTECKADTI